MNKKIILIFFAFLLSLNHQAQTISQAKELIEEGDCEAAEELLKKIVSSKPKDAEASYQLGIALLCNGKRNEAYNEFLSAKKKGSRDANLSLAQIAIDRFETKEAQNYIEDYQKALKKAKKGTPDLSGDISDRLEHIESMLERVEQVVVIDSVQVPAAEFLKYYNLSPESGYLFDPAHDTSFQYPFADPTVVFETGDHRERIWAMENKDHLYELVSSSALINNKWDAPVNLGSFLNEGGDANYPFLMADGITMYFANDGDRSIGGLDIFLTRRNGEDFLEPTNIGFPFNSTANDYMLVIDESKGIGWWATDRNSAPDSITIYTFIPNELRVNYSSDTPNISSLARLDSYKATWGDKDYSSDRRLMATNSILNNRSEGPSFNLAIPGVGIYTKLEDFRNKEARNLMRQYLIACKQLSTKNNELHEMRLSYRKNSTTALKNKILLTENEINNQQKTLFKMRNEIIAAETK